MCGFELWKDILIFESFKENGRVIAWLNCNSYIHWKLH